jgi:hypothetical protein
MTTTPDEPTIQGSLLDEEVASVGVVRARVTPRQRLNALQAAGLERFNEAWAKPLWRFTIMGASSAAALALGLGLYLAIRPVPKPDYENDQIGIAFNYTLLTEEFNSLPVEERINLVSQLYGRVKDMDSSESAMMAAFFAGIAGEAREQLERNAGKLLVDAADLVAKDYTAIPPEQRDDYLDDAYVRLVRLTAPFDPSIERRTDEEILDRGRRDAKQGLDEMNSGRVSAQDASRLMLFMNRQTEKSASVSQQQRLTLFMRDMSRRLRNPDG